MSRQVMETIEHTYIGTTLDLRLFRMGDRWVLGKELL